VATASGPVQGENVIAFGPVPSRRLGRSLGINNIPAKTCSYSCVYCQLGRTTQLITKRIPFYEPERILAQIQEKVAQCQAKGQAIDYLTFVPDGEPTLDANLGKEIGMLRPMGLRVAVLTNASLIDRADVREDLAEADLVSLKVDAVSEPFWHRVNRPHRSLSLLGILRGMRDFSRSFKGELISETMLIDGVNDSEEEISRIAEFLKDLELSTAYIAIPTRPPAEKLVRATNERIINLAYQIMSASLGKDKVQYLIGFEGDAFASTGEAETDLLAITSVHPMRREAVEHLLKKANADWDAVERLLRERKLIEIRHDGHTFYMRRIRSRN
jgi:wyosine [tRNA(Phe)-imidazoG37] synthetase (radical SAM superfamily)